MRKSIVMLSLLAVLMLPVSASALPLIDIEAAVGGWYTSPSGTLAYEPRVGFANDFLDIEDDLNYDDEFEVMGRLKVDMPLIIPNIYLMATPMEFEETSRVNTPFEFGGEDFQDFKSKFRLDQYDIGLFYSVPLLETATLNKLDVEFGLNARIVDAEASVESTTALTAKASVSETIPIPMVYLGVQFRPIERLALEAEGRGISYDGDSVYSFIGRVKYKVFGPLFAAGGWRYDAYDIEEDDLIIDTDLGGPFLETGLSF